MLADGRLVVGLCKAIDTHGNVILSQAHERHFSVSGVRVLDMGACVLRGDSVALVGEYDGEVDEKTNWSELFVEPLAACLY